MHLSHAKMSVLKHFPELISTLKGLLILNISHIRWSEFQKSLPFKTGLEGRNHLLCNEASAEQIGTVYLALSQVMSTQSSVFMSESLM